MLDTAQKVDDVRARVTAGGYHVSDRGGGFLVRDPWDTGVAFSASG